MISPGSAPSTPASNDPACVTILPSSNSAVSSPRYQTLPSASWAYQSKVSSISSPSYADRVADDPGGDPVRDLLGLARGRDDDLDLRAFLVDLVVSPPRSRLHRPVAVRDLGAEVGRVEIDGLAALRQRWGRRRGIRLGRPGGRLVVRAGRQRRSDHERRRGRRHQAEPLQRRAGLRRLSRHRSLRSRHRPRRRRPGSPRRARRRSGCRRRE